jgi:predicted GNAT superfamily acetyltransferase
MKNSNSLVFNDRYNNYVIISRTIITSDMINVRSSAIKLVQDLIPNFSASAGP